MYSRQYVKVSEALSESGQEVINLAYRRAKECNSVEVNTLHLLIALISFEKGVGLKSATDMGVNLDLLRLEAENLLVKHSDFDVSKGESRLSSRSRFCLRHASSIASRAESINIEPEHIFFGILAEEKSQARGILKCFIDIEKLKPPTASDNLDNQFKNAIGDDEVAKRRAVEFICSNLRDCINSEGSSMRFLEKDSLRNLLHIIRDKRIPICPELEDALMEVATSITDLDIIKLCGTIFKRIPDKLASLHSDLEKVKPGSLEESCIGCLIQSMTRNLPVPVDFYERLKRVSVE